MAEQQELQQQWSEFFRKPEVVSGLLQFGASLLTPGSGGLGPAISGGAQAAARTHMFGLQEEQRAAENARAQQEMALRERGVGIEEQGLGLQEQRLGLDDRRLQQDMADARLGRSLQRQEIAQRAALAAQEAALTREAMHREEQWARVNFLRQAEADRFQRDLATRTLEEYQIPSLAGQSSPVDITRSIFDAAFQEALTAQQGLALPPGNPSPEDQARWDLMINDPMGYALARTAAATSGVSGGATTAQPKASPVPKLPAAPDVTGPAEGYPKYEDITLQEWRTILADPELEKDAIDVYGADKVEAQKKRVAGFME